MELDPWVRREKHATLGANVVVELHGKRISDGGGLDSAQPAPVTRLCDSECGQGTRWSGSNIHSRPQRHPPPGRAHWAVVADPGSSTIRAGTRSARTSAKDSLTDSNGRRW